LPPRNGASKQVLATRASRTTPVRSMN